MTQSWAEIRTDWMRLVSYATVVGFYIYLNLHPGAGNFVGHFSLRLNLGKVLGGLSGSQTLLGTQATFLGSCFSSSYRGQLKLLLGVVNKYVVNVSILVIISSLGEHSNSTYFHHTKTHPLNISLLFCVHCLRNDQKSFS